MKKRDLLFAGLLLMGVTAFAQPTRTPQDAKVIFTQTFEDDWDKWQSTPVDTITEIQYFKGVTGGNQQFSNAWSDARFKDDNLLTRTDSVLILYNGVMLTDDAADIAARKYKDDDYSIVEDKSQSRKDAFEKWGEDGGDKVFHFVSGGRFDASGNDVVGTGNKYTDNYRRNLFVRFRDGVIEEESSYRITFYVKATATNPAFTPRMHTALHRGYFHSEKIFTMGLQNDNDNLLYNTAIEYTKDDFIPGEWEKVTYMEYYLNDSIADYYMLSSGYWWSDSWTWKAADNGTEGDLKFIKQPDKFFFRLSFQSDSTDFVVDNISLTKSWIAGCEYYGDKMRVDFGYKTNLKDLVAQAKKETNIDAIELPSDCFEVWCLKAGGDPDNDADWEDMPIRSAEYHGDGYMYMFTDFFEIGGEEFPFEFDNYDQVLVTFINPVDNEKIALKYTGTGKDVANLFPKALDTAWIRAGKIVPNFYNELATPNPNVFKGVHSMKDLPPVCQELPYEEGSFGLEPVTSMQFKFSRKVLADNLGEASEKVIAYVGDQIWIPSVNDEVLTITQPAGAAALKGDVEVHIIQIMGVGPTEEGDEVICHYHFGEFSRVFNAEVLKQTDWRSEITEPGDWDRPCPPSLWVYSSDDGFFQGTGNNMSPYKKLGLYKMTDDGKHGDALFYLAGRGSGKIGHLYSVENLKKGNYELRFGGFGWARNIKTTIYIYSKPAEMAYEVLEAAKKTILAEYTPSGNNSWSGNAAETAWPSVTEDFAFTFSVPADGDYVIEWAIPREGSQSYYGGAISNYAIWSAGDLSYASTKALNEAVEAANARIALADANIAIYGGDIYTATAATAEYYKIGGAFDAEKKNKPSEWAAAKKVVDNATNALKLRMDTVDAFVKQRDAVTLKLDEASASSGLDVYVALQNVKSAADVYPVTRKTGKEIYEFNDYMKNAVAALDNRLAINKKFADELARAAQLIEDAAKPGFEEYTALIGVYNANKDFDVITSADADVNATYATVHEAANAYDFRVQGFQVKTKGIFALRDLAGSLGSNIADDAVVASALASVEDDDDQLAAVLKSAIKIAIYQKLAANDAIYDEDSLDITPFIKNYYLYQTPKVVERTDKNMPDNAGAGADPDGAQIQHTQHKWNSGDLNGKMPIWVMITGVDYDDLYPGWTVSSTATGNAMVTGDKNYTAYKNGLPVFDAEIGMDWNGRADMKTQLADLPQGYFTLGVQLPEFTANEGEGKIAQLTVTLPDSTYVGKAVTSGAQTLAVDSIHVTEGDVPAIDFMLRSQNGWSRADNWFLAFRPDKDYEYDEAIAAEQGKLSSLLTVVDAAKAQAANVEFYTLGGMKVAAPKAGEILIRKTTVGGKVQVDKVLLK